MTKATQELPRGIRLRGSKYFVDVSMHGERKTATCLTLAEAIEKKDELRLALETGKEIKQPRANAASWTLQQALDKVLSLPKPDGWKDTSYEKQGTINATDAINFFGPNQKLAALSRDRIDAWLRDCEARGNSNSTVNRKLSALSKLAKVAHDYGGLAEPLKLPRQRKEPVGRIRQFSIEEEQALIAYLNVIGEEDIAEAVAVLIDTGMRRGELLNVRPSDVDSETNTLLIYGVEGKGTKNGEVRSVPMTKRVRAILKGRKRGAVCFELSERELRTAWEKAKAHLGLVNDPDFTLHVCRHTCASRLVRAGVTLPVVMKWLGHKNITTTMRYAHLYPQDLMNAVKALEN